MRELKEYIHYYNNTRIKEKLKGMSPINIDKSTFWVQFISKGSLFACVPERVIMLTLSFCNIRFY
ncbi:IS3 family transposase [Priestia megaterium]|uniref:IS3 family transposase n=1 Tax=Priestia megaterium TaxID=1404 RepID=UPI003F6B9822